MFNVVVTNPEIDVRGLGTIIVNGDNMPSALDDTYFGETTVGSIVDHTFTITNTGPAALGLTGNPKVIITGSTEFSVFMQPSVSSVNPAGTTTFVVRYQPQNGGLDNAIIEIQSDDCDDASFTFTVSGLVNCSINITYVNVTPVGCPGANDGAIAITAVCTSCLNGNKDIRYSLDNMNFINTTGLFTSLAAGNYTAYVRDVNDVSCNANDGPHAVAPGVDAVAPQISCPSNIGVNTDAGVCSAVVTYTTPVGTDNCSGPATMQTVGLASGSAFPLGTTTQTFRVTDGSGTTAFCSFVVTVSDNEAPQIVCPSNVIVDMDPALCTASNVSLGVAIVTDNCNMVIVPDNDAIEPYQRGSNTITWSANDGNGNISTSTQTVTVLYPEINITGNGQTIVNGDNTTSTADFTDFGPQSPGSQTYKTFMVQNTGSQTLQLTGMPMVTISGDAEFSVLTQPLSSTIATGAPALSFQIRYAPLAAGNHTAVVSIQNNDCDESAYTFTVSSCATSVYYKDQDGDGYGNPDSIRASCFHTSGYVTNNRTVMTMPQL